MTHLENFEAQKDQNDTRRDEDTCQDEEIFAGRGNIHDKNNMEEMDSSLNASNELKTQDDGLDEFSLCSALRSGLFKFWDKRPQKTGLDRSFVPLNYLFKSSPIPCKMTQNLLRYSKFRQKRVTNLIVNWKFHIFVNSERIYVFLVLI